MMRLSGPTRMVSGAFGFLLLLAVAIIVSQYAHLLWNNVRNVSSNPANCRNGTNSKPICERDFRGVLKKFAACRRAASIAGERNESGGATLCRSM